jgi:protein-S-isoprenylcysteine O-methyltransferase Ste14
MWFRKQLFRLRGAIWAAFFFVALLIASPTTSGIAIGIVSVLAGQAIRFWAAGTIGRYRGERVSAEELVTWGPYAFCRNPLYVGNFFIGLGWATIAGWGIAPFYAGVFYLLYAIGIVPLEEKFLLDTFGDEYARYRSKTPKFLPHLPSAGERTGPFSLSVLVQSERYSVLVTLFGTILLCLRTLV